MVLQVLSSELEDDLPEHFLGIHLTRNHAKGSVRIYERDYISRSATEFGSLCSNEKFIHRCQMKPW